MIAAHVIGVVILAIAEGGQEPDTTTDERDKAIELTGRPGVERGRWGRAFSAASC